jgi:hypothetical protein
MGLLTVLLPARCDDLGLRGSLFGFNRSVSELEARFAR